MRFRDAAFWNEVISAAREIGRAEDDADFDLFIEAAAQDAFRVVGEIEQQAARQAASAATADVEDRAMEGIEGVASEAWDEVDG